MAQPRRSPRTIHPFDPRVCNVHGSEDRWRGYGLAPGEGMSRYKNGDNNQGPPIFGTTAAYEIARDPMAPNPDDLVVLLVRLRGTLTIEEYEEHYLWLFNRKLFYDAQGVLGTGILKDASLHVNLPRGSSKWIVYFAVFPWWESVNILLRYEVRTCERTTGNRRPHTAMRVPVTSWAHSAIASHRPWTQGDYTRGDRNGFQINVPDAFNKARYGSQNHLFIIDNYIDKDLQEFWDQSGTFKRLQEGYDLYPDHTDGYVDPEPTYMTHHGAACASLAAGRYYGVAPGAHIIPINVFAEGQTGAYPSDILTGLIWATACIAAHNLQHCAVINVSIEGGQDEADRMAGLLIERYLIPMGIVVVYGAGNYNRRISQAEPIHPQIHDGVLTVGGMNRQGRWWGNALSLNIHGGSNYGNSVTIAAPAELIPVPWRRDPNGITPLYHVTGTSFAAALVSGLVLCLLDKRKVRTRDKIMRKIMRHTRTQPYVFGHIRVLSIN
ncbi:subtilisin-like protein [Ascobolus immersus RN42]|uniref:Subtilisin-like protein n=1 Tax=Ascobolus immersus RN42 TaxID=1160509 RepID=A0A3N4I658_ASCIM|nr:subtilisin-like protein [Ascobolus immersus RN42]